jgi:hypothetical protein
MERVGEHPVTHGPLSVRWLAYDIGSPRAGATATARLVLENAGSASWRSRGTRGDNLAYHWLDPLANPIVWDGSRTYLPPVVAPGEQVELDVTLVAPRPPGRYLLSFDLVEEYRFWFAEIGSATLDVPVDVAPRIAERRLAVVVHGGEDEETRRTLDAQDEPLVTEDAEAVAHLVPGALPAPEWSRHLLDAHAEGWAAVGGSVAAEGRADRKALAPWSASGRNPRPDQPLLFPSLLDGIEPSTYHGLPAYEGEEMLFDGRAIVRLRRRSDRRRG